MDFQNFQIKFQKVEVEEFPNRVSKTPLISIIVLAYQHADFIAQCLEGILNQKTEFPYEIIIGEDGSTDGTKEIVRGFAKSYPDRIKLFFHNPLNKIKVLNETTGNFNAAFCFFQSRGKYIAICEGDDYWTDEYKLQKQVDFLKDNPDFVLSYHKFEEKYESSSSKENRTTIEQPAKDLSKKELSGLIYHPLLSTVCFRNYLYDLPEEMMKVINVDSFLISILGTFGKAKFQPEIQTSVYRKHSGGIWTKKNRELQLLTKIHLFKNLVAYFRKKNKSFMDSFQKDLNNTRKMLSVLYLKDLKLFKAVKLLLGLF